MPELPEVETTLRGITPHVLGQTISQVVIRQPRLRWPIAGDLPEQLRGRRIESLWRRGKYLLLDCGHGSLILHLGMSGSLRILPAETPAGKHDHVDLVFHHGFSLRLRDPRRFGAVLWTSASPLEHPLLKSLGPEPLAEGFSGNHLLAAARGRKSPVKSFIMDSKTVVGVGNIYANEALFRAGIHPKRAAGRIALARYQRLVDSIRAVLLEAIAQGGTTLRDFVNQAGNPGYFQQTLSVYGRGGEDCRHCGEPIRSTRLGQRATYYCPLCQR